MFDVFISYSSANEEIATDIQRKIKREYKSDVFKANIDTIAGGENFQKVLMEKLLDSRYLVVLLSKASVESQWVHLEIIQAIMHNKKIFPLKIEDCTISENLNFKLGCSQIYDGTQDINNGIERILLQIRRERENDANSFKKNAKDSGLTDYYSPVFPILFHAEQISGLLLVCLIAQMLIAMFRMIEPAEEFLVAILIGGIWSFLHVPVRLTIIRMNKAIQLNNGSAMFCKYCLNRFSLLWIFPASRRMAYGLLSQAISLKDYYALKYISKKNHLAAEKFDDLNSVTSFSSIAKPRKGKSIRAWIICGIFGSMAINAVVGFSISLFGMPIIAFLSN